MAENTTAQDSKRKSVGSDLVIPIAALAFTVYYFYTIINAPWTAQVAAFLVGAVLIVLILLFIVKCIRLLKTGEGAFNFDILAQPISFLPKRLGLLILTVAYNFIVPTLGFTITTFLFLNMAMLLLGGGKKKGFIFLLSTILRLHQIGYWLSGCTKFQIVHS